MSYSYVCDLTVAVLSVMVLFMINIVYVPRNRRLLYVKLALYNLVYACVLSIFFYEYLLPRVGIINEFWVYLVHNAQQISLITELLLFIFYLFNLVGYKNKKAYVMLGVAVLLFYALELTSIKTRIGFYIEGDMIHNGSITSLYLVWYVMAMPVLAATIIRENRIIINRIYRAVSVAFGLCIGITVLQYLCHTDTYTTLTYFIPILIIVFLFHSNSYNSTYGALDREALRGRVEELVRRHNSFYFVYARINHFTSIETEQRVLEDFKNFAEKTDYTDYLFRYNDETFILLYRSDECMDMLAKLFEELHARYQLGHRVLAIPSNDACHSLRDYIELCKYLRGKHEESYLRVGDQEIADFEKYLIVKKQLTDIAEQVNLDDERVLVYCQPIYDVRRQTFTTAESLMRLELPELGLIYPDMFIPVAEQTGHIHALTMIILNKVCRYLSMHEQPDRISVNFSMYEITKSGFYDDIMRILSGYQFDRSRVAFEITESLDAEHLDDIRVILQEFRDIGIKIYLDDFGTGYSNLEHITNLPIDVVKFDKSLVDSSGYSERSKYLVEGMSNMFHSIGYQLLYEGIETAPDQERCIGMQAQYLQGYRYSRPIPIEQLADFIKNPPKECAEVKN